MKSEKPLDKRVRSRLHVLLATSAVMLSVPPAIITIAVGVLNANGSTLPRHFLPVSVLALYGGALIVGPVVGLTVIAILIWGVDAPTADRSGATRLWYWTALTAVLTVVLDPLWIGAFPWMYFAAGGSR